MYKLEESWPEDTSHFKAQVFCTDVLSFGDTSEVYVAQRGDVKSKMLVFSESGALLRSWDTMQIHMPHGTRVRVPAGQGLAGAEIWVTDVGNGPLGCCLKMFDREGNLKTTLGTPGEKGTSLDPLQFDQVGDVAFNDAGEMFVVDGDGGMNNRLLKLSTDYQLLWSVGGEGAAPGQFSIPHCVEVDRYGQVWVADRRNRRIQVFSGDTGDYIGEWALDEDVYTARFSADRSHILALQMKARRIVVIAAPKEPGCLGDCQVIDSMQMKEGAQPHLLSVSQSTGAIYVGDIGGNTCYKFLPSV
ncbi:PREDICTED: NHL repeat-containing protein 3-like [Branchiostoma belcheri]|uniref:NHL repeat-containing protein 3-like n=1 Tax=Branchiostoma belcheri TaxID=7741 RepID=A0A6P4YXD3_BRABE|nr:PREDICTED: NHL repeat-containing protein 3-like [Branchiostoma belcheri]